MGQIREPKDVDFTVFSFLSLNLALLLRFFYGAAPTSSSSLNTDKTFSKIGFIFL